MPDTDNEDLLAQLLHECTVLITSEKEFGTGFFISPNHLLTCAHVVGVTTAIGDQIKFKWNGEEHQGKLKGIHGQLGVNGLVYPDLALIHHSIQEAPCVSIDPSFRDNDSFYSRGFPGTKLGGESISIHCHGDASEDGSEDRRFLKFKGDRIVPGMSGAPLLNRRTGQVCGMIKRTIDKNSEAGGYGVRAERFVYYFPEVAAQNKRYHELDKRWAKAVHAAKHPRADRRVVNLDTILKLDREKQNGLLLSEIRRGYREKQGVPQFYVLTGHQKERHDSFVNRFRRFGADRFLSRDSSRWRVDTALYCATRHIIGAGTSLEDIHADLIACLDPHLTFEPHLPLPTASEIKRRLGRDGRALIIRHHISAKELHDDTLTLLRKYIGFWGASPNDVTDPLIWIFLCIQYPDDCVRGQKGLMSKLLHPTSSRLIARIEEGLGLLQSPSISCPVSALPQLGCVDYQAVESWADEFGGTKKASIIKRVDEAVFQKKEFGSRLSWWKVRKHSGNCAHMIEIESVLEEFATLER